MEVTPVLLLFLSMADLPTFLYLLPLVLRPRKQSAVLYHMLIGQMTALENVCFEGIIVAIPAGITIQSHTPTHPPVPAFPLSSNPTSLPAS